MFKKPCLKVKNLQKSAYLWTIPRHFLLWQLLTRNWDWVRLPTFDWKKKCDSFSSYLCSKEGVAKVNTVLSAPNWNPGHLTVFNFQHHQIFLKYEIWPLLLWRWLEDPAQLADHCMLLSTVVRISGSRSGRRGTTKKTRETCPCPTTASEADKQSWAGWKKVQIYPVGELSLGHF